MLNQLNLTIGVIANPPVRPHFPEFSRPVGGTSLCLFGVSSSLEFRSSVAIPISYKLSEVPGSVTSAEKGPIWRVRVDFFRFANCIKMLLGSNRHSKWTIFSTL